MIPLTLRPDQAALIADAATRLFSHRQSVLLVAPTGSGKTVMFCSLVASWPTARTMILVHRDELIEQVSNTLARVGVEHGCIAPGYANHGRRLVQVASVMTLVRRLADYPSPDLVIIDEAHHAIPNSTWGTILRAWPAAARLGVTATPERLGGEGLRDTFTHLVVGPSVGTLMAQGALCPYTLFAPASVCADGVPRRGGDYAKNALAPIMDTMSVTGNAVQHYLALARGKRALVFCVSLEHAQHVTEDFRRQGIMAARMDGTLTRETRRGLVAEFASGRIPVLTSCEIVSEGFDVPAIEVAILLRPTQSLALHLQQIGRALRPYPGKATALILDHAGNTFRHGLPDDERCWSLDGKATRRQQEGAQPAVSVRTCGSCFAACRSGTLVCVHCGQPFPIASRAVTEVEGTLVRVDPMVARRVARQEQRQASTLADLLAIERQRGYKPGWAWHVQKARQRNQEHVA